MLDLLKSEMARRLLIWITAITAVLLLVALALVNWGLDADHDFWHAQLLTVQAIATGLFGGVAASAFLVFLTRYLFHHEARLEQTVVIDTLTARRMHLHAIAKTDTWSHNGHIGRWVRTTVFPKFAEDAHGGGSKQVALLLIDPKIDSLVRAYADHRRQVEAVPREVDAKRDARIEVLATIILAAHYDQYVPGVRVRIALRNNLDLFRVDVSDTCAFTTLTRDKAPAIVFNKLADTDSDHFLAAKTNFEFAMSIATPVDLSQAIPEEPSVDDVRQFLERIGFDEYSSLAAEVLTRSRSKFNRSR